ncbi:hypothetical protein C8Q76DRAFT_694727 [Earliella scabrosa]|nr:hypothetical protein C8Q76DRAFT_694727 [Earliella scabrosa]
MSMDRLPNEILIDIFEIDHQESSICECDYDEVSIVQKKGEHTCYWPRLMLVCRLWRALALSVPQLWQEIHVRNGLQWFEIALPRSGNGPLDLHFHAASAKVAILALPKLAGLTRRIRTLALPPLGASQYRKTLALLNKPFPILSVLQLAITSEIGLIISHAPLDISLAHFPALRTVRLSCFLIDWEPEAYSKLKRIDLRGCTVSSFGGLYSFEQLMDMLAGCRVLEELELQQSISSIVIVNLPPEVEDYPPVHLEKLRRLVIWDKAPVVARFLSYIRVPPTALVRLAGTHDRHVNIHALSDAALSLLPKDRDPSALPILQSVKRASITFLGEIAKMRGWDGDTKVTIKLRASVPKKWETYLERGLREFRAIFAGAPLEELVVTGLHDYVSDSATWVDLLAAFPKLRLLEVYGFGDPQHVLAALSHTAKVPGSASRDAASAGFARCHCAGKHGG